MTDYVVQNGNNMPMQGPLIPDPFVPYQCPGNATLSIICRTDRAVLDKYLAPTAFTPSSDLYLVYVSDFSNCDKAAFMDGGIIVPVLYDGREGANYLFEYEDNDAAIAAGRDLWGYPKKYAEISLVRDGDTVTGRIHRRSTDILNIACDLSDPVELPAVTTAPHFNTHIQPGPDGKVLRRRIIERDTSPDFQLKSSQTGRATVALAGLPSDPLHELRPREILGGLYTVGDFFATEENGWGKTIAEFD